MVGPGVWDDQEPGLPEGGLDLIGERSGGEATSDGGSADVTGKLQARALGKRPKTEERWKINILSIINM